MAYQLKLTNSPPALQLIRQAGYSLIEMLVALGVLGVMMPALFAGFIAIQEGKPQQQERLRAAALMQETIEALRVIREQGWETIATNGTYHPVKTADSWTLAAGPETIDDMSRSIVISDAYRTAGALTPAGTLDPSTKKITVTIGWSQPLVSAIDSTFYMTRYLDNLSFVHTTEADFTQAGYLANSVSIVSDGGGAIRLGSAGPGSGNWCIPAIVGSLDLPRQGAARAVTAIQGEVFSGTGLNASGVSLAYARVTDTHPPVPSLQGTFDGFKTNDVFGTAGYGYLATDTNAKEVVIVNTATMTEAGYFNLPGAVQASSLFVLGTRGYVTTGNQLYIFDVSSIVGSASQNQLGVVTLAANAKSVYVIGNYAYVALDATTNQLQIVDVSNPSSPSIVGSLTVNGLQGRDVYVSPSGERAYLATAASGSQPEFFLINTQTKSSPTVISTYDTNGMDPQAVDMVLSGNRAIIVGVGGEEYQVVTIAPETSPVRCGGLNEDTGIYDIASVVEADTDAYAYINTGQANSELKIIEGGPGGSFSLNGTYESPPFDSNSSTAFNRLSYTATLPGTTSLRFQVAAAPPAGGGCNGATYTFVGPDGTSGTYFTELNNGLPFSSDGIGYENPAQCFKYKAYLDTTNILNSPLLEDVTINYSP